MYTTTWEHSLQLFREHCEQGGSGSLKVEAGKKGGSTILLALELPDGLLRRRSAQRSSRTWKPAGRIRRDQERMEEWLQRRREAWPRNRGEERRGSEVNPPVTLFAPEKPAHPVLGPRCTTGEALLGTRAGERDQDGPDSDGTGEEELTSSHIPQLDGGDEVVTSGDEPDASEDNHEASEDEPETRICEDKPKTSEDNHETRKNQPEASTAGSKPKHYSSFVHPRNQVGDWRAKYGWKPK